MQETILKIGRQYRSHPVHVFREVRVYPHKSKFFFLALEEASEAGRQPSSLSVSDYNIFISAVQCCGSGMFIPDPNPIFSITDPESKSFRIRIKAFRYF
jgi:hypothetical protein